MKKAQPEYTIAILANTMKNCEMVKSGIKPNDQFRYVYIVSADNLRGWRLSGAIVDGSFNYNKRKYEILKMLDYCFA